MANRALLIVDMQNGFCHPDGSFSRIGMGLEVLTSYELAKIARVSEGYDIGLGDRTPIGA